MSFIKREIERIAIELRKGQETPNYEELYAAQQALSWALDPAGSKSPYNMLMDIPAGSEDCSVCLRRVRLSDIRQSADSLAQ